MNIDQVIQDFINKRRDCVWVNQTANSYGRDLVQLLDEQGNELAWRWLSDGHTGWQNPPSVIGNHLGLPAGVNQYDLSQGFGNATITLGAEDGANYSKLPPRPPWVC
ncbi:hypothetical protein [Enterobacter sp.]|uniref:hypothetical protein n=1 Tax=Enterobacter sp. TaxID=42895 RepID=UPI00296ED2BD|nr:hypothetical protein [Enterobacter sp.]